MATGAGYTRATGMRI